MITLPSNFILFELSKISVSMDLVLSHRCAIPRLASSGSHSAVSHHTRCWWTHSQPWLIIWFYNISAWVLWDIYHIDFTELVAELNYIFPLSCSRICKKGDRVKQYPPLNGTISMRIDGTCAYYVQFLGLQPRDFDFPIRTCLRALWQ